MLVGPGFRFLSGLSVYTCRLANALAETHDVSVVLLDRLIPTWLYPGASRVGDDLTSLRYDDSVRIAGKLDWYWGAGISALSRRLRNDPPEVIVLQWWTAAALHTYLMVMRLARREGIPVLIEFHEVQDTGEAKVPFAASYCQRYLRALVRGAAGVICHTQHDRAALSTTLGSELFDRTPMRIAPHGPYDHLSAVAAPSTSSAAADPVRVLFFGLIRPYKGGEDLIYALDRMSPQQAGQVQVDFVGETWEDWTVPLEVIYASPYRDRIHLDNRYVSDNDAARYFASADVLVLPYRRASSSGPLHIAMSQGIHVVMYAVDGLVEAVRDYDGAILVKPNDVDGLRDAILSVVDRRKERFANPHSWQPLVHAIDSLAPSTQLR
jgi:glycosyltransferase involved in cell wall biosynthesis